MRHVLRRSEPTGVRLERLAAEESLPLVLTTASLKLADLLSGPFLLNIPPYQRPYSWGNKQVQQLLDDLVEAAGLGSSDTVDDVYFLGNILLMDVNGTVTKRISAKMSAREFDVVDGQQRLVTLLTLFCLLRDLDEKKPSRNVFKPWCSARSAAGSSALSAFAFRCRNAIARCSSSRY